MNSYLDSFARSRALGLAVRALVGGAGLALASPALAQETILVGDFNGGKVVRFEFPSGAPLDHFVGNGMTAGSNFGQIVFGPDGNLYICSPAANLVTRVNGQTGYPIGTFVTVGSGGLNQPYAATFGPDGRFYVASRGNHTVLVYNGTTGASIGAFVTASLGTLTNPEGMAFGPNGNLFVASYTNDKVIEYNGTTGALVGEAITAAQAGLNAPRSVVFDAAGRMYVSSQLSNAILVKDGATVSVLASNSTIPTLTQPGQLTLSATGELLVACTGSNTVQRVNRLTGASLGTAVTAGAGGLTNTYGIADIAGPVLPCYANCDGSTGSPLLSAADFVCFLAKFRAGCP